MNIYLMGTLFSEPSLVALLIYPFWRGFMANQVRILFILMMIHSISIELLWASDHQKMTYEDYAIIKEKVIELKQRVERLEQRTHNPIDKQKIASQIDELNEEIEEYADILEKVEKKSLLDLINIKAELRTQFDWFNFKGHDYEPYTTIKVGAEKKERVRMLPTNRLRFVLRANLSDNFKFSSRLGMTRHWQDDDIPVYPELNFLNTSTKPTNLDIKVERAYIDYFFTPVDNLPMALTFGRMPSTDGLPKDLRDNTQRKSTYPGLAYDCESDGIALSILLDNYIPLPQPAFRFLWIRRLDDNAQYFLDQKLSDKYGVYRDDEHAMDTLNIYISQIETYLPDPLHETIFIVNYIWIPDVPPSDLRYNSGLKNFFDPNITMLYPDIPDTEGELFKLTCFLESKNFLQSGIDWFGAVSFIQSKAKGALRFMFDPAAAGLPGEPILARLAYDKYKDFPQAEELKPLRNAPPPIGLLNCDGESDQSGHALHLGFRYNLPIEKFNFPKIGVEYNYGSHYWFGMNAGSADKLNKLDIRGSVWDFYYIQPINKHFMTRLSYTHVNFNYDDGMSFYHGKPMEIDHQVSQFSFVLDARF